MSELRDAINVIQESGLADADKGRLSRLLRLLSMHAADLNGAELKYARIAAGLSLGQAGKLTGYGPAGISRIELDADPGRFDLKPEVAAKLDEVYGLGGGAGAAVIRAKLPEEDR